MVILYISCSVLVSTQFRLGFTNIYSIDEYKIKFAFSILNSLSYMHSPIPSFTEDQILFLLQRVDILHFLEQSCSYIIQFLRSGSVFKMAIYQLFTMPFVMPQPGF